jgi:hypothetical protein
VGVKITVDKSNFVPANLVSKVVDEKLGPAFWTFAANEWHRFYLDFVPMDTGMLAQNVRITPGEIEHYEPYANRIYNGAYMNFRKDKHPLASAHWDEAAKPTQLPKLYRSFNAYVRGGKPL